MVHPSHNHIPAYQRPGFRQSLGDPEGWILDEEDSRGGSLTYRKGDEIAVVPSIWYNQPVAWRVKAMLYYAERADKSAAVKDAEAASPSGKPWHAAEAAKARADAARLRGLADEMERTGKVLA